MTKRTVCKANLANLVATVFQEDQISDPAQAYHLGQFLEHCAPPYTTTDTASEQYQVVEVAWFEDDVPIFKANVEVN